MTLHLTTLTKFCATSATSATPDPKITPFCHLNITEFKFFAFFCQKIWKKAIVHRIFAVRNEKQH